LIPQKVVADDREKAGGVPGELASLGLRVYFSALPVADYVVSPEIAVERKTLPDLLASVYDSRLFSQAARLAAAYPKPYLIVEGDSKELERLAKNVKAYYGAIANVTLAYGLRMVYTANQRETAMAIAGLLSHSRARPLTEPPVRAPPRAGGAARQQESLVAALPGIGPKLARRLLQKYGTPRRVMRLTAGELSMTEGIGWKRAERIKEVLDGQFVRGAKGPEQARLE
jgi:DNA excision repair protein ERCC-4